MRTLDRMAYIVSALAQISAPLLLIGLSLSLGCSAMGDKDIFTSMDEDRRSWTSVERSTMTAAYVYWSNASAPLGRYLLIRDGDFLCAVRFLNFRRGRDASEGSVWSSGQETLTSAYEWYELDQVGSAVTVKDQGKSTAKFTAPWGFGHLVLGGGPENVRCGKREFGWHYPANIDFFQRPDSDRKLAPTRWDQISDIRLDDARLVWYSFDPKRRDLRIPLGNL